MNQNIKIAKQLIKLAKELIANDKIDLIKKLQNYNKKWMSNKIQDRDYNDCEHDLIDIEKAFNKIKDVSFFDGNSKDFSEYIKNIKSNELNELIKRIKDDDDNFQQVADGNYLKQVRKPGGGHGNNQKITNYKDIDEMEEIVGLNK